MVIINTIAFDIQIQQIQYKTCNSIVADIKTMKRKQNSCNQSIFSTFAHIAHAVLDEASVSHVTYVWGEQYDTTLPSTHAVMCFYVAIRWIVETYIT